METSLSSRRRSHAVRNGPQLTASFLCAAKEGRIQSVRKLLEMGVDVNATDEFGRTALIMASANGHTDVIVELLKHDQVDVNVGERKRAY